MEHGISRSDKTGYRGGKSLIFAIGIAVVAVESAVKYSFAFKRMQTRQRGD